MNRKVQITILALSTITGAILFSYFSQVMEIAVKTDHAKLFGKVIEHEKLDFIDILKKGMINIPNLYWFFMIFVIFITINMLLWMYIKWAK